MSPVLAKRDSVREAMVLSHTVTTSGILCTTHSFGECNIHHILVELSDRHVGGNKVVRSGRIRENDGLLGVGLVRSHLDEAVTLVLSEKARRATSASSGGSSPEYVVRLEFPRNFHVIDVLDPHVDGVPAVRVTLSRRKVIMTWNQNV